MSSGTFYSNKDSIPSSAVGTRRSSAQVCVILVSGFLLSGVLTWISARTWEELQRLQIEMIAYTPDRFSVGMKLSEGVGDLADGLAQIQLTDLDAEREGFNRKVEKLLSLIERSKASLESPRELALLQAFESEMRTFLTNTVSYQGKGVKGIRRWTAARLKQEIGEHASKLSTLAEEMVRGQQLSRHVVSDRMQHIIAGMGQLWKGSLALLITCLLAMIWAIYRTWIAPLRTELDESRLVIERQEKLASLGTLAAGVAHEIRNPLTAMKLRLYSLEGALRRDAAEMEDLAILKGELHRLERIVKDFLQFARPAEPDIHSVSPRVLFLQVHTLLAAELEKRGIRLHVQEGSESAVMADSRQMAQVLINLVQNASDSIAAPGDIFLRWRPVNSPPAPLSGPFVSLEVVDSGAGIPLELQRRIFDPFFSTKTSGTGLGLPIAARMVEKQGGLIQFESCVGEGTVFKVLLRRA